jgi:hypothetical protein
VLTPSSQAQAAAQTRPASGAPINTNAPMR